jgi:hypothetical protein
MCRICIDNIDKREEKKMNNQRCIKELSEAELFAKWNNNEVELETLFTWGGRTHYLFNCPACGYSHLWISEEWGVVPNQPALGWQY